MNKVIIFEHEGGVAVIYPADGKTVEDCMKSVPEGAAHHVVDATSLPADRYFRRAWKLGEGRVDIDIEGAKEVQRDRWRKMRDPKLKSLDVDFLVAVEDASPSRRNEIKAKKQALRDITLTDLPDDLEAIRNTIPEILQS